MERKCTVSASYCGFDGKLASKNLFCFVQDHLTYLFGQNGVSNFDLRDKYNAMWVISKQKIKVFSRPSWEEEITVRGRMVASSRLTCYGLIQAYNKDGELLMESLSECCVLDKTTFRFVRLSTLSLNLDEADVDNNFDFEEFVPDEKVNLTVSNSLIDMSMHMNNGFALHPVFDLFHLDEIRQIESRSFEVGIKYNRQAMYGMSLSLGKKQKDNGYLFAYLDEEGNNVENGYIRYLD